MTVNQCIHITHMYNFCTFIISNGLLLNTLFYSFIDYKICKNTVFLVLRDKEHLK